MYSCLIIYLISKCNVILANKQTLPFLNNLILPKCAWISYYHQCIELSWDHWDLCQCCGDIGLRDKLHSQIPFETQLSLLFTHKNGIIKANVPHTNFHPWWIWCFYHDTWDGRVKLTPFFPAHTWPITNTWRGPKSMMKIEIEDWI